MSRLPMRTLRHGALRWILRPCPDRVAPSLELSNNEPLADEHNALLPPDSFHLPVGRPVTHTIYRDAAHPSRLVLPYTMG